MLILLMAYEGVNRFIQASILPALDWIVTVYLVVVLCSEAQIPGEKLS